MRAVLQRVSEARVEVDGRVIGRIGSGLLVLLGVGQGDGPGQSAWLAAKTAELRIFSDDSGKFNLSLKDVGGQALVVSQFTLWGDCRKGRRPSFAHAGAPDLAEPLYRDFCQRLEAQGVPVQTGEFGAMMDVHLVNQGPVTILLDTDKKS